MAVVYSGPGLPDSISAFPQIVTEARLIRDSIVTILNTRLGQRLFQPDFGSRLHDLVFEPNDQGVLIMIEEDVINAISKWEPRVQLMGIRVQPDENRVIVNLSMNIRRLNIPFNLPLEITRNRSPEV
mgnify:CR=1 FL=1